MKFKIGDIITARRNGMKYVSHNPYVYRDKRFSLFYRFVQKQKPQNHPLTKIFI